MAAIQGIRKHGKLLIVVIGLALLAFITEEFFRATEAQRNQNSGVISTINGKKIHSQEYSQLIESYKSYLSMTQGKTTFTDDEAEIRKEFKHLKEIFDTLKTDYFANQPQFKEISMGMSDDYPIAVEEGATLVRVGSKIFGARNYNI